MFFIYQIHDREQRPFRLCVDISKKQIFIYDSHAEETKFKDDVLLYHIRSFEKIFIGQDASLGRRADGNTCLIHFGQFRYWWIGESIYEFITSEPILEYYSPILSQIPSQIPAQSSMNGVPHPYAFSCHYTYFLLPRDGKMYFVETHKVNKQKRYEFLWDTLEKTPSALYFTAIRTLTSSKQYSTDHLKISNGEEIESVKQSSNK